MEYDSLLLLNGMYAPGFFDNEDLILSNVLWRIRWSFMHMAFITIFMKIYDFFESG